MLQIITRLLSAAILLSCGFAPAFATDRAGETLVTRAYIDSDSANEIDDIFAIYRLLMAEEVKVVGLSSAGFATFALAPEGGHAPSFLASTYRSQAMNEDFLSLLRLRNKVSHPLGALSPMPNKSTPIDSPAARDIISKAIATPDGERLRVYALGASTNVASAILLEPDIRQKIEVYFVGFFFEDGKLTFPVKDLNTAGDRNAAQAMLNSGVALHVMPANTLLDFWWPKAEAERQFRGKGAAQDWMLNRWHDFPAIMMDWFDDSESLTAALAKKPGHWIMWDVALIEASLHPDLARSTKIEVAERPVTVWTSIDAPGMQKNFWRETEEKSVPDAERSDPG